MNSVNMNTYSYLIIFIKKVLRGIYSTKNLRSYLIQFLEEKRSMKLQLHLIFGFLLGNLCPSL